MAAWCGHGRFWRAGSRRRRALVLALTGSVGAAAALAPGQAVLAAKSKPFVAGDATAIAQGFQIAPRTGGLAAAMSVGTTIAQYRDTLAQASSQTLNLGVVGTTLTVQCDSTPPTLKPSQLPQPLIAESTHGNAHSVKNTAGSGDNGLIAVAGHEAVAVKTVPSALATFDGSSLVLPGLMSVSGLHSEGESHLIPGKARVANAMAQVGEVSLLKGAIVLKNMRWTAMQRGGSQAGQHSSFSIGGITLAGKPLPVDQASLASTIDSLNKLLAPTGLHITLPTRLFQGGILNETPLVIGIDNSDLGGKVINPVLGGLQPVTDPLRAALDGISCGFGKLFTVADLAAAALDGTGGMDLNLGGASANTDGRTFANPFGTQTLGGGGHQIGNNQASGPSSTPTSSSTGGTSVPSTTLPGASTTTTGNAGGTPQVAGAVNVSSSCSTVSPARRPSCSDGQGLTVGLIALAAVGSIAGADYLAMRRRRRLPAVQL